MTTLRRQRLPLALLAMLCAIAGAVPRTAAVAASPEERIVVNRNTGLAIHGFDPVAYFTDGAAKLGLADLEHSHGGATWRFRNEGNRAAFADRPDVYTPRFGGYDPVGLARGFGRTGHPEIWMIVEQKLYLFYSPQARSDFAAGMADILADAEANWPKVSRTLEP